MFEKGFGHTNARLFPIHLEEKNWYGCKLRWPVLHIDAVQGKTMCAFLYNVHSFQLHS